MNERQIRKMIQEELQKYASQNMFGVNATPIHTHNGTDSVPIPLSSTLESVPIKAQQGICDIGVYTTEATCVGNGGVWTPGGVFNSATLDTQKVNNEYLTDKQNPQTVYTLPVNIIYGFGPGVHGAFNGGDAEQGTMVFFENGLTLSQLWIKTINGWYGISPDLIA